MHFEKFQLLNNRNNCVLINLETITKVESTPTGDGCRVHTADNTDPVEIVGTLDEMCELFSLVCEGTPEPVAELIPEDYQEYHEKETKKRKKGKKDE